MPPAAPLLMITRAHGSRTLSLYLYPGSGPHLLGPRPVRRHRQVWRLQMSWRRRVRLLRALSGGNAFVRCIMFLTSASCATDRSLLLPRQRDNHVACTAAREDQTPCLQYLFIPVHVALPPPPLLRFSILPFSCSSPLSPHHHLISF